MGIFRRMGNAFARFMYGRNGMDRLNQSLLWGYIGVFLAQTLFTMLKQRAPALLCEILLWPLMLVVLFRMFSKNLAKRQGENTRFLQGIWAVKNRRSGAKERHADKTHKYFTCKQCKTICRVPVGKGNIVITCPKCGAQMQGKT